MSNSEEPRRDRDAARRKAQNHFTASEQRDTLVRQELEKERTALAARTAKLKALRLAKEAEDRIVAERRSAEKACRSRPPHLQVIDLRIEVVVVVVVVVVIIHARAHPVAIIAVLIAYEMISRTEIANIAEILDASAIEPEIIAAHAIAIVAVAARLKSRS